MPRWVYPLDPSCPDVARFRASLADPLTAAADVADDLVDDFEPRHRRRCARCQEYGAAHADVE